MNNLLTKRASAPKSLQLILLLALCPALIIFAFTPNKPFILGYTVFVINGPSMQPDYPAYSTVIIRKAALPELKIGDAIAFKSKALGGKPAFHRITKVTTEGVYTKGDNNRIEDNQLITEADLIGKEAFAITFLAHYLAAVKTPAGFAIFFIVPALTLLFICMLFKLLRTTKRTI